jgi:hypothetical protein
MSNRHLHPVLTIALLLGLLAGAIPAFAQTEEPTAAPRILIRLTEQTNSTRLVFTIQADGSLILEQQRQQDETWQTVWRQPGRIAPVEVDKLVAPFLAKLDDTYAPKDAADGCASLVLEVKAATSGARRIEIGCGRGQTIPAELQAGIDNLLAIRQPLMTLLTFRWSGGFAFRSTRLTIQNDGTLTLTDEVRKTSVAWQVSQDKLDELRKLLRSEAVAAYAPTLPSACADCWIYTITTMTVQGMQTIKLDDAILSRSDVPAEVRQLVGLLKAIRPPEGVATQAVPTEGR